MQGKGQLIRECDVREMLELVGQVSEFHTVPQRLKHAIAAIARLVDAESAFCTRWRRDPNSGATQPYAVLAHGWTQRQLADAIRVSDGDPLNEYVNLDLTRRKCREGLPLATVPYQFDTDRARRRAEVAAAFAEVVGGDYGLLVNVPCDRDGHFATLGLIRDQHRRQRGRFAEREIQVARLVWGSLKFLHRAPLAAVNNHLCGAKLPPRLQQVLAGIKQGLPSKEIARRLNLSVHTVHDYVKELYRRFGVSSRAELLSLWVDSEV